MQTEGFAVSIQHIKALVADPEFYTKCIAYFFMKDMGLALSKSYAAAVDARAKNKGKKKGGCRSCGGKKKNPNPEFIIKPALVTFKRHSQALFDAGPEHLLPLADFLESKLGYRPPHFLMYIAQPDKSRRELKFG